MFGETGKIYSNFRKIQILISARFLTEVLPVLKPEVKLQTISTNSVFLYIR
jgi:hypothetical protein